VDVIGTWCIQGWTRKPTRCNLLLMACFAYINVSQGSVETYARCSGIFDIHLTANFPRNLLVKKNFLIRLGIDRIMIMCLWPVFWPTLYTCRVTRYELTIRYEIAYYFSGQPVGRHCCCGSMGQTDGRADGHPNRYIDPAPYTVWAASISRTKIISVVVISVYF